MVGTNQDAKRRGIYLALFTDPEGDSCFSVYRQLNKNNKKSNFLKIKKVTQQELCLQFTNILGIFTSAFLRFCCKFIMKIIFYLPVNTDKPKFVAFLVFVCTTASFIAQISSSEKDAIFGSGRKTVNSQGYSELLEPIKTRENCYSPIW